MRRLVVILPASLTALGGGVALTARIIPAADPRAAFTVSVSPARQSAVRGEQRAAGTRTLTLTVKRHRFRHFSPKLGPVRRSVPQGATATYVGLATR